MCSAMLSAGTRSPVMGEIRYLSDGNAGGAALGALGSYPRLIWMFAPGAVGGRGGLGPGSNGAPGGRGISSEPTLFCKMQSMCVLQIKYLFRAIF